MVTTNDQCNQLVLLDAPHKQGFDRFFNRQLKLLDQCSNRLAVGGIHQTELFGRRAALSLAGDRLGLFDVGRVIGAVAECDIVFTGLGQYMKLMRARAANRAGICLNGTEIQSQTRENLAVRLMHPVIRFLQ